MVDQAHTIPAFRHITAAIQDDIGILTLNRPDVMNSLSRGMIREIHAALDMFEAEKPRCVLMTGTGRGFCAGANLSDDEGGAAEEPSDLSALERIFHPVFRRLYALPVPLVAAVNGAAAGAGMSLALAADLIICARSAYFMQAFRRIGLVPDCGSTWLLPRLVGRARAMELALLGERLPAETAHQWGLVNRVVDDATLVDESLALARNLAAGPSLALGQIRHLIAESFENSFETQIALEDKAQNLALASQDAKEGVAAFLAKRPASFTGA